MSAVRMISKQPMQSLVEDMSSKRTKSVELQVPREKIFETLKDHLLTDELDNKSISVVFSFGQNEERTTGEGAVRELFTLFFEECLNPDRKMFEGLGNLMVPTNNDTATENKWFYCLGKAIVLSMLSGGAGFPYLANYCLQYIESSFDIVYDRTLADRASKSRKLQIKPVLSILNEMESISTEDQLSSLVQVEEMNQLLADLNWRQTVKLSQKAELISKAVQLLMLEERQEALHQIREGLNTLGFLDKALHCTDFNRFLVHDKSHCVNGDFMRERLLPQLYEMRATTEQQNEIITIAANCLSEISDVQAINLFQFITGMRSLPARDLKLQVEINQQNPTDKLPRAVTCFSLLLLPQGNKSPKEFLNSFKIALENRHGFGRF